MMDRWLSGKANTTENRGLESTDNSIFVGRQYRLTEKKESRMAQWATCPMLEVLHPAGVNLSKKPGDSCDSSDTPISKGGFPSMFA